MQIRLATESDVPPLARLFAGSVRTLGPDAYTPSQVEAWAASAEDLVAFREFILGPRTYVVFDASGVCGFCGLERDGHVASLYVREDRLRRGIGRRLLQAVIDDAATSCIPRLFAEASEFSAPLFLKIGFESVGTEQVERNGEAFVRHLVERKINDRSKNSG